MLSMTSLCSFCAWKSIAATVRADRSSRGSWLLRYLLTDIMLWLYVRHWHRHRRDHFVVQTLLTAPDIFGMSIGMTNCTWYAVNTMMTMLVLLAGMAGSNSILI